MGSESPLCDSVLSKEFLVCTAFHAYSEVLPGLGTRSSPSGDALRSSPGSADVSSATAAAISKRRAGRPRSQAFLVSARRAPCTLKRSSNMLAHFPKVLLNNRGPLSCAVRPLPSLAECPGLAAGHLGKTNHDLSLFLCLASFSSMRALTSFVTSVVGSGLLAGKRMEALLSSYSLSSAA